MVQPQVRTEASNSPPSSLGTYCRAALGRRLVSAVIDNEVRWLGGTGSERVLKDRQKREKVSWKMGK